MSRVTELLSFLVRSEQAKLVADDIKGWWALWSKRASRFTDPIDAAIAGGASADRLGYAFAAGYHAALRCLVPALGGEHLVALCATEEGGAHPRAIKSTLTADDAGFVISGNKRWSTLSTEAAELLVLASTGVDSAGKSQLRLARVAANAPGMEIRQMPATPFAPEIPHAEITFDRVRVGAVLEGDGWERYVKPFRTVEDLHVHGALLGYLVGVGRRSAWPETDIERLLSLVVTTRALAHEPAAASEIHLAVAGLIDETSRMVTELEPRWQCVGAEERARWERDRGLLQVAGSARAARKKRAWQTLSGVEIDAAET